MGMMANTPPAGKGSKRDLFRDSMTVQEKADFVHRNGMDAFLRLPAQNPVFQQRRSAMKGEEVVNFIRQFGAAAWDNLPE